jgi:hypothetical protein
MATPGLLNMSAAQKRTGLTREAIIELIRSGTFKGRAPYFSARALNLPEAGFNSPWWIDEASVDAYIAEHGVRKVKSIKKRLVKRDLARFASKDPDQWCYAAHLLNDLGIKPRVHNGYPTYHYTTAQQVRDAIERRIVELDGEIQTVTDKYRKQIKELKRKRRACNVALSRSKAPE